MDLLKSIPTGTKVPDVINVIIEISRDSQNKYEYSQKHGLLKLDRVLGVPLGYPANYGFVPRAWSRDDDPLDALVITHEPVVPGVLIEARPVGLLKMKDGGKQDNKLLCVAEHDPRFADVRDIGQLTKGTLNGIADFFRIYKKTEGIQTRVEGWEPAASAKKEISYCVELFKKKKLKARKSKK